MKATPQAIPEVILFEPKVFGDDRGFSSRASTTPASKKPSASR
jgi:dTDP-4-dehydrorhamnose 3,5-epimerase-like enzyme